MLAAGKTTMMTPKSSVFFHKNSKSMSTITVGNHDIYEPVNAVLLYGGLCAVSSFGWVQGSARLLAQAD
nr:hypothetical protein EC90111_3711 [Escherichia coli 9.0111]